MKNLNENTLAEQPVIEWFKELGYEYAFGPDIGPGGRYEERTDYRDVVLETKLRRSLKRINPDIQDEILSQVANQIIAFEHQDLELGNKEMYEMLTKGITVTVKDIHGQERGRVVKIFDFDKPQNNEFLVVNQFAVRGPEKVRKPDVVIFINGIPVALYELKNPSDPTATITDAFAQLHDTYKKDIPKIFFYNQILAVSDLMKAKHGTVSATWDFFSPWSGIDSEEENNTDKSQLEVLTKGIFPKERLMDIVKYFIIFEADAEKDATKFTKKICMYHQYFGVNTLVKNTLEAVKGGKKIGVFWHTQGSGKSLSMVFYANKIREIEELAGPTLLFLTDRNDLDHQLYKTFLRTGYPTSKQAESIKGLEDTLRGAGAELLFTTIQKFDFDKPLSERDNIIVIADEAHRSQYADYAGDVRIALPNASFMGITGTPIAFNDRNTQLVFGKIASTYTIDRSEKDETTVPIFYDSRLIPLHYANEYIDEDFDQLFEEHPIDVKESLKKKFATLEKLVGADDRLRKIAKDIVFHFTHRKVAGKAMIVTMSRKIAVDLYQIMKSIPNCPELVVIISSNNEYQEKIQEELSNKTLEKRFKNPADPLQMVIVCDMWLTGFDVPHLNTLYLDKLLKGHTLMQAIARVNRRSKDKDAGLIVDYIGVADSLKKAIAIYTSDIQKQPMEPIEILVKKMLEKYEVVKTYFADITYTDWESLSHTEQATLFSTTVNVLITDKQTGLIDEKKKKDFLQQSNHLFKLFSLIMPHDAALKIKNDIEFFEKVKKALVKFTSVEKPYIDQDIRLKFEELVSQGIIAEGVVRVTSPHENPSVMILDKNFLEETRKTKLKNLTIEAIAKLLKEELQLKIKTNKNRYASLLQMIEEAIEQYENNIINSARLIERLVEIAREIQTAEQEGRKLELSQEELSFYDALSKDGKRIKSDELKQLAKEIVKEIKRDITIDWTNHEIIKARIRANVRFVLLRHKIEYEDLNSITEKIYEQAVIMYQNYPNV